jgi:hypothetical protein
LTAEQVANELFSRGIAYVSFKEHDDYNPGRVVITDKVSVLVYLHGHYIVEIDRSLPTRPNLCRLDGRSRVDGLQYDVEFALADRLQVA